MSLGVSLSDTICGLPITPSVFRLSSITGSVSSSSTITIEGGGLSPNKQLQRTVQTASRRGARASFHYARALRYNRRRDAAELRR